MDIVNRIAVRLPSHIDLDDLHNTGVIGLMDAIEKYDHEKNCKFKTYAEFRIKGAILDELRALDWVPRSVRARAREIQRSLGELEHRLQRSPTDEELAEHMNMPTEVLQERLGEIASLGVADIIDSFAGLRVLPAGGGSAFGKSRDTFLLPDDADHPRLVSIYGGKLTAHRATSEQVVRKLAPLLPKRSILADTRSLSLQKK